LEPLQDTNPDSASLPETGKERPVAKKRKGEAEKLLADNAARPTRRALNRQKEVYYTAQPFHTRKSFVIARKFYFSYVASI
jgi:hypothetical protein